LVDNIAYNYNGLLFIMTPCAMECARDGKRMLKENLADKM